MFQVLTCLPADHDRFLVFLAAAVWLVGSFAFLFLLGRSEECRRDRTQRWLAIAALAGGVGIWSTHFIAMLAYEGGMPVSFELVQTLLSVVAAVAFFWIALVVRAALRGWLAALAAGTIASLGVAVMHFMGMGALVASARVEYDFVPILAGAVFSTGAFTAAFRVFDVAQGWRRIAASAGLLIVAVCTLHFVSMSATTLVPDISLPGAETGWDRHWLVGIIVAAAATLIILTGLSAVVDRYLTDLRGLADATLEGLIIVHGNRMIEVNDRAARMIGMTQARLIGRAPDIWLSAADGDPIAAARAEPVEARLRDDLDPDRVLEVAVREIEYRGRDSMVVAIRDLTEKKAAQRQIEHMACHDALTELANRTLLDERLNRAIPLARKKGEAVALIALDLDRFKAVNDIFGHGEGDRVLCKVADMLRSVVRENDTVARVGGDEFMILQIGARQPEGAMALSTRILDKFAREMDLGRDPKAVGVSLGIAVCPRDARDAESLRYAADVALYRSKEAGRGVASFFDREMELAVRGRRALEHDLRHAIERGELWIAYQPLVAAHGASITGYEALLRWNHPRLGELLPAKFIPVAEETGSIIQIGEWVLRQACRAAAKWPSHLTVAVNVSAVQFQAGNLVAMVAEILEKEGCPPARLELEVTESALLRNREKAFETLHALKQMGLRVVMDDFGTGYSSLSNLQSFPFDKIKIDRSFIAAIEADETARSIVRAIVGIGRSLRLAVVAEGVETVAQHLIVMQEGCREAQGYLFGRPLALPAHEEQPHQEQETRPAGGASRIASEDGLAAARP